MSDLLPPNATAQERALANTIARISDVPLAARKMWNPDTIPANLLPWMAWAFSVDDWNNNWTEQEKRNVIKNSLFVHKHKGTLAAIKRAVEPLGYIIRIVEWWEDTPQAEPYTFRLEVGLLDKGVDESIYDQFTRLIETNKNLRSHMKALTIKSEIKGVAYFGAGMVSGITTTVYPYAIENLDSAGGVFTAAAEQSVDAVSVYPLT